MSTDDKLDEMLNEMTDKEVYQYICSFYTDGKVHDIESAREFMYKLLQEEKESLE